MLFVPIRQSRHKVTSFTGDIRHESAKMAVMAVKYYFEYLVCVNGHGDKRPTSAHDHRLFLYLLSVSSREPETRIVREAVVSLPFYIYDLATPLPAVMKHSASP